MVLEKTLTECEVEFVVDTRQRYYTPKSGGPSLKPMGICITGPSGPGRADDRFSLNKLSTLASEWNGGVSSSKAEPTLPSSNVSGGISTSDLVASLNKNYESPFTVQEKSIIDNICKEVERSTGISSSKMEPYNPASVQESPVFQPSSAPNIGFPAPEVEHKSSLTSSTSIVNTLSKPQASISSSQMKAKPEVQSYEQPKPLKLITPSEFSQQPPKAKFYESDFKLLHPNDSKESFTVHKIRPSPKVNHTFELYNKKEVTLHVLEKKTDDGRPANLHLDLGRDHRGKKLNVEKKGGDNTRLKDLYPIFLAEGKFKRRF